jgi:cytochrome P450
VPGVEECPAHGVASEFDPFDIADPFEFYARVRAEEPVFFSEELGYWVVSRYEDILPIFKDPATFSSENTQAPYKPRPPEVQQILDDGEFRAYSGLSARQPPDHTRLRGFINKAFTPRRVATLEPGVRELTVSMIERFASRGHADLVAELTRDLPAFVIFRLLGMPDEDATKVKEWAESRVYLNFGDLPLEEQLHHAENLVKYWRYCLELVQKRFDEPRDDLPSDLVRIYQEGDKSISIDEMAGLVYGQLTAGHETTTSLLGEGLRLLLTERELWEDLCADHSLIPTAVEEMLRLATPVFAWKRKVKTPATIGGSVRVQPGDNVLLLLGSANHDGAMFHDPEAIDLHRENARQHLSFGHGIHFCLGASLARLEAQVVLEELTTRIPSLRLAPGQQFEYSANSTFRAPRSVLAEWDTAAPLVLPLERCSLGDVELVGGKAASLGAMIAAGLPVPPGFAVTTEAFGDELAEPVAKAIAAAYAALGDDVPVAVRSSATAEDSSEASFAGMQETYLWVVGEEEVLEHVMRCWESLRSDRSLAYRHDRGFDHTDIRMGVVVQKMVDARAAGVAMTLNPSNGDRSVIAIESSFGLGESVVGGTVTPDSFLVDKVMLEVVKSDIAAKTSELVRDPSGHGVLEKLVAAERCTQPSLTSEEVKAVAALAKRAEQHYGSPQDVEWAIDDGGVVLLQSRPETVWSRKPPEAVSKPAYSFGMSSLVNTLVNPLASRRTDVDPDD